jgi:hypothetical protein
MKHAPSCPESQLGLQERQQPFILEENYHMGHPISREIMGQMGAKRFEISDSLCFRTTYPACQR